MGSVQLSPIFGLTSDARGSLVYRDVYEPYSENSVIPISVIFTPHLSLVQDILVANYISIL